MPEPDPLEALRKLEKSLHNEYQTMLPLQIPLRAAIAAWKKERASYQKAEGVLVQSLRDSVAIYDALRAEVLKVAEEIGCSGGLQSVRLEGWAARLRKACE